MFLPATAPLLLLWIELRHVQLEMYDYAGIARERHPPAHTLREGTVKLPDARIESRHFTAAAMAFRRT